MSRRTRRGRATGMTVGILGLAGALASGVPNVHAAQASPSPTIERAPASNDPPSAADAPTFDEPSEPSAEDPEADQPPSGPSTAEPSPESTRIDTALGEAAERRRARAPAESIVELTALLESLDPAVVRRDPDLRAALLLELAALHDTAFALDADPEHLLQAQALLDRLLAETEVHGYAAALVDQALATRARIDDRLLASRTEATISSDGPASTSPSPRDRRSTPGRGLRIAGFSLLGLGASATAVALTGVGVGQAANDTIVATTRPSQQPQRLDAIERGRRSNAVALWGSIAASTLVVAGVTTLVIGTVRRRKSRRAPVSARLASTPGGAW